MDTEHKSEHRSETKRSPLHRRRDTGKRSYSRRDIPLKMTKKVDDVIPPIGDNIESYLLEE